MWVPLRSGGAFRSRDRKRGDAETRPILVATREECTIRAYVRRRRIRHGHFQQGAVNSHVDEPAPASPIFDAVFADENPSRCRDEDLSSGRLEDISSGRYRKGSQVVPSVTGKGPGEQ